MIGGIVVVMVAMSSVLAYVLVQRELSNEVDDFLVTRSREAGSALAGLDFERLAANPNLEDAFRFGALTRPDAGVQVIVNGYETPFTVSEPMLPTTETDWQIAARGIENQQLVQLLDHRVVDDERYRVLTVSTAQGAVMIGRSVADIDETLDRLRSWLYLICLASAVMSALIGWIVADQVLRPVSRLSEATRQVTATGRFDADIPVEGRDEIGGLASSFNAMLSALRTSRDQQERLVRDANHELRTPLTSLRTNLGVLRRRGSEIDVESRDSIMSDMDVEIQELTSLVSEVVGSATASSALDQEKFAEVDLAEIATVVAHRIERRTGRRVVVTAPYDCWVFGSASALERAIGNLVSNAVKFSPDGESVELDVDINGATVRDHGPGIPPGDEDRIFDRFYRSDQTRTLPGSGLGLAIVSDIATVHGGHVFARNRPDGGAIVGFTIGTAYSSSDL